MVLIFHISVSLRSASLQKLEDVSNMSLTSIIKVGCSQLELLDWWLLRGQQKSLLLCLEGTQAWNDHGALDMRAEKKYFCLDCDSDSAERSRIKWAMRLNYLQKQLHCCWNIFVQCYEVPFKILKGDGKTLSATEVCQWKLEVAGKFLENMPVL